MKDMLDKILQIEQRYKELGETLSDPAVIQDYNKFRDLSKQRKSMEETVNLYYEWKSTTEAIEDAKQMLFEEKDEEMRSFLKAEMEENESKIPVYEERMKVLLLPRDPMDDKDIMLEIRGSAGGDEANIFAGDLMRMYLRYAERISFLTFFASWFFSLTAILEPTKTPEVVKDLLMFSRYFSPTILLAPIKT
jgi:peptide chain release factor 1